MASTYISDNQAVLNKLLDGIMLGYRVEIRANVLSVEISEEKILEILSIVASEYSDIYREHTGINNNVRQIDLVKVKIGEHEFEGKEETTIKSIASSNGFKKVEK